MTHRPERPARRSSQTRRWLLPAVIGCMAVVVACGAVATAAVWTAPALAILAPRVATNDTTPRITMRAEHVTPGAANAIQVWADGERIRASDIATRTNHVTMTLASLSEGRHRIRVRTGAIGLLQRHVDATWTITVDTAPPNIRVPHPKGSADGPATSDVKSTRFTVRTEPHATVRVTSGQFVTTGEADERGRARMLARLREGRQTVLVAAADVAGNTRYRRVPVLVDSLPPVARFQVPAVLRISEWSGTANASDASDISVVFSIDGEASDTVSAAQAGRMTWTLMNDGPLAEGVHIMRFMARDGFNHATTITRRTLVDSTEQLGDNAVGRGARGADVHQLHLALIDKGVFRKREGAAAREWRTQKFGAATATAVRSFQVSKGLAPDGVAGDETMAALTMHIEINRASHSLTLFRLDRVEKTYSVAVGSSQYPTPSGEFHIQDKQLNPTWTPPPDSPWAKGLKKIAPGPNNPLGTRWMALGGSVGIHGTNNPASIGYSVSHGCIRMAIPDVEDLFDRVEVGTPVRIV